MGKGRPTGNKKANNPTQKEKSVPSSTSRGLNVWLAVAIASVAYLVYSQSGGKDIADDGSRRSNVAPVATAWLDAAAEDTKPELDFLTAPVPRDQPLMRIYPPQKGLHVLKQMGGGLLQVFQDADGITPPRNATVTAKTCLLYTSPSPRDS